MTSDDAYQILRDAVLNKRQVTLAYHGHIREVCPHTLGTKNGKPKMLCYQFGGGSSTGLPDGGEWRCMFLDEVSDVSSHKGEWHTGNRHTQRQTCVDDVDVEVAY